MRLLFAWFLSCFSSIYSGGFANPKGSLPNYIFAVTIVAKACANSRWHAPWSARWEFDFVLFESLRNYIKSYQIYKLKDSLNLRMCQNRRNKVSFQENYFKLVFIKEYIRKVWVRFKYKIYSLFIVFIQNTYDPKNKVASNFRHKHNIKRQKP